MLSSMFLVIFQCVQIHPPCSFLVFSANPWYIWGPHRVCAQTHSPLIGQKSRTKCTTCTTVTRAGRSSRRPTTPWWRSLHPCCTACSTTTTPTTRNLATSCGGARMNWGQGELSSHAGNHAKFHLYSTFHTDLQHNMLYIEIVTPQLKSPSRNLLALQRDKGYCRHQNRAKFSQVPLPMLSPPWTSSRPAHLLPPPLLLFTWQR